ncbi:cellulase family glycosylhydrolase [candidate division KSB1 bacterium]|nr:cellulase family glycosylhydrolase [candidate division KSB1 bacterium]
MKRTMIVFLVMISTVRGVDMQFKRGVNLTGWLQTSGPRQIQFTKFTKRDFENIKSLGCDVIRLPINLHFMTGGAPDYIVDPLFYYFLDQIVDYAEELELHLILDNHTFDPAENTDPNVGDILVPVWTQMAEHYKGRSTYLYYEVLNEPHGISDSKWNQIQQNVVEAIRVVDQKHTIIIGPAGWNSYNNFKYMPLYDDDNLIYTFHFYDPFLFTHQGASWTDPSMEPLAGVPFPYDAARMPECPPELKGTWIESGLKYYQNDGTINRVKELIDIAVDFQNIRNAPLLCGEFGVYIPNSNNDDRVYWYEIVRNYLEEKGIAWTIWDYTGGFGLFEAGSNEMFDYDLNISLVEALGLAVPPQKEFVLQPDTTGFDMYLDYIGRNISESSWASQGIIDFYSEDGPVIGKYCIHWSGVDQYQHIGFDFKPNKDLTTLLKQGYAIDFWLRGDTPGTSFDIRFIDTKTGDPDDHPWRMRYTIDEKVAAWNWKWHHIQIPLDEFTEHGSWDNGWYNPVGDYDWAAVDRFEIVSEHGNLEGVSFQFDNIRIVDPAVVGLENEPIIMNSFRLYPNYPNPFNPVTTIIYYVPAYQHVDIAVYNVAGQKVRTLVNAKQTAGTYSIVWDGLDNSGRAVSGGLYIYKMQAKAYRQSRKMILMR